MDEMDIEINTLEGIRARMAIWREKNRVNRCSSNRQRVYRSLTTLEHPLNGAWVEILENQAFSGA